MELCRVVPIKANSIIKGWRVITPSGAVMLATTKREAEIFVDFVNGELIFLVGMGVHEENNQCL